jgi:hypothetical protein
MFIILVVILSLRAYLSMCYLEPVRPNWTPPEKRYCSCISYLGGYFIVFGGRNFEKKFNDLWTNNIWFKTWERLSIPIGVIMSNLYLGPRSESLILISDTEHKEMYIFGGKDEYGYITDIWYYANDIGYLEKVLDFKEIRGLADYASGIHERNSKEMIFVYGGRTLSKFSTDLWM